MQELPAPPTLLSFKCYLWQKLSKDKQLYTDLNGKSGIAVTERNPFKRKEHLQKSFRGEMRNKQKQYAVSPFIPTWNSDGRYNIAYISTLHLLRFPAKKLCLHEKQWRQLKLLPLRGYTNPCLKDFTAYPKLLWKARLCPETEFCMETAEISKRTPLHNYSNCPCSRNTVVKSSILPAILARSTSKHAPRS